jgi:hypothetical protein
MTVALVNCSAEMTQADRDLNAVQNSITSNISPAGKSYRNGKLAGGTAVLVNDLAAYWVSGGTVYAANGIAKTWSPDTEFTLDSRISFSTVKSAVSK